MLVACSALLDTLRTLHFAAAIGVTGVCPAYINLKVALPGNIIDFSQATGGSRLDINGINGITIQNFTSTNTAYSAINVISSTQVLILQPRAISPGTAGVTIQGSDTVEVSGAWITGSKADGIDIAGSTNVNIHDGACEGNVPTVIHPDCVQEWSVTGYPLQHIIVQNMTAVGQTMGFDLWDHSDFGATDIQFLNNHAAITEWNCVGVINAHQLVVSGNDCHTMGGGLGPPGLNITLSPGAVITKNTVGAPIAQPIQ